MGRYDDMNVSDLRLELSLRYDTEHGRLSLGIMLLRIFSLHTYNNDMGIVSDISSHNVL